MDEGRCECGDSEGQHDPVTRVCLSKLPPLAAEELPAWSCRCRRYLAARRPLGPWHWHARTGSWEAVRAG